MCETKGLPSNEVKGGDVQRSCHLAIETKVAARRRAATTCRVDNSNGLLWRAPKWYNRDRHLFKRYIPLIKMVAEAGWQPVTYAVSDNPRVYIERFGPDVEGNIYFTLLNDSGDTQQTEITIMAERLRIKTVKDMRDLISGEKLEVVPKDGEMTITLTMESGRVSVVSNAISP